MERKKRSEKMEYKHMIIPGEGYEINQFVADIADAGYIVYRCHWCDEQFTPTFVVINGTHRFYMAVGDDHIHIEIGGAVQI